jgi:hypothetical protein
MFARPIDLRGEQLGLATGETMAHLNHLLHRGELTVEPGADGAMWYRLRAAAGGAAAAAAD